MTAEAPHPNADTHRRAADAAALKFNEAEIKSLALRDAAFRDHEVETINLDAVLPRGSNDDFHGAALSSRQIKSPQSPEEKKQRLKVATFKQTIEDFRLTNHLARVSMAEVKRGDVVLIKTIVGNIYLRIIDRIRAQRADTGEILCECHYELSDQGIPSHAASIQLPLCASNYTITNPDGSKRLASRKLKMTTQATLPPHVTNLLDERFFVEFAIHASPQAEQIRVIDAVRWLTRIGLKLKALIDENKRIEREKKQKKEDEIRCKKEEKARIREEKREAAEAKKNQR